MNKKQKQILIAVISMVAIMLLFPPFHVVWSNGMIYNVGYSLIFEPPKKGSVGAIVNVSMLLIQWVGVLIVGGLAFFLAKEDSKGSHPIDITKIDNQLIDSHPTSNINDLKITEIKLTDKKVLSGVGGWLTFLIFGMTVLGPLLGFGRLDLEFASAEQQFPLVTSLANWKAYKSATWDAFFVISAISFYGGYGLAVGKDWSVVRIAKFILWLTGPCATVVMGWVIPTMFLDNSFVNYSDFVGGLISSIIATIIWTIYLSKSKRVRNTYKKI